MTATLSRHNRYLDYATVDAVLRHIVSVDFPDPFPKGQAWNAAWQKPPPVIQRIIELTSSLFFRSSSDQPVPLLSHPSFRGYDKHIWGTLDDQSPMSHLNAGALEDFLRLGPRERPPPPKGLVDINFLRAEHRAAQEQADHLEEQMKTLRHHPTVVIRKAVESAIAAASPEAAESSAELLEKVKRDEAEALAPLLELEGKLSAAKQTLQETAAAIHADHGVYVLETGI